MEFNKIYNEDCIDGMKRLSDESVDLIVTDPPYLISYKTNRRVDRQHDFCSEILNDNNPELIENYIRECYRVLKNDAAMYMFCSSKTADIFKQNCENAGFDVKNIIVWVKNNWTAGDLEAQFGQQYEPMLLLNKGRRKFNGTRVSDVWSFPRVSEQMQLHQNQKPVELIERCILKHSDKGDVVFDGFLGSGTTAIAAINTKRYYIGFELDRRYFEICQRRIAEAESQLTLF